jgi:hypothetical protein
MATENSSDQTLNPILRLSSAQNQPDSAPWEACKPLGKYNKVDSQNYVVANNDKHYESKKKCPEQSTP